MRVDILSDSNCCSEPVSYAAVEEDSTSGLVIEVFDDLDKVCADVVLLHGCPHGRGLAGAGDISHIECVGLGSPLWYSAMIFSACGFSLFSMIFSMTLLG